jgi:hypothetical protein
VVLVDLFRLALEITKRALPVSSSSEVVVGAQVSLESSAIEPVAAPLPGVVSECRSMVL